MPWVVDPRYPAAAVMRVILDNRKTHKPAALYEAFAPAEGRRLLQKLALHDPPKHGSWLHRAEMELSVLSRQCLHRRIPDDTPLPQAIAAYEEQRHAAKATMAWRFPTTDAREKLPRLYPSHSH
jgi:hypothetical protein